MDEAIVILTELAAIPEETATASIGLGTAYNLKGDRDNALFHYQKALELAPENYNALLGMASVNYRTKHYPNAVNYYRKATSLRPELPDGYWGLAVAYHMMQDKKQASENAKIFIKMVPDSRYRESLEEMIID
jgi:tetratricopeptide (TPR) repeat protein